jgi:hypothetical protein
MDPVDRGDDCETIEVVGPDDDADGFKPPVDCDDHNAAAHPGGTDVPGNGVDEDCNGADAPLLDLDQDGVTGPPDCDDNNPAIRQGARDIPQNGIDEDCTGADAPYPRLLTKIAFGHAFAGLGTKVTRFRATEVPADAVVEVRCKGRGCPFKKKRFKPKAGKVDVHALFKRPLLAGAVIELRVLAPEAIGPVRRIAIRAAGKRPKTTNLCMTPKAAAPAKCA